MKNKLIAIAITGWLALTVWAGTITIEIPSADETRAAEAFGAILELRDESGKPRPATIAEIQSATAAWLTQTTQDYERRKHQSDFTPRSLVLGTPPVESKTASPTRTPPPTATPKKKK